MLGKELLDILCCPECKGELAYSPDNETLTCVKCRKMFGVKDDIPVMLVRDDRR